MIVSAAQPQGNAPLFSSHSRVWGPKIWYFPIDRSELLQDYQDNASMFAALDSLLNAPGIMESIDTVFITAAASPVGNSKYNRQLSIRRAEAMQSYIRQRYPQTGNRLHIHPVGIDWEGFHSLIQKDTLFSLHSFPLHLIENEDSRLNTLRTRAKNSNNWERLVNEICPLLQYVSIRLRLEDGRTVPAQTCSPLREAIEEGYRLPGADTVYIYQKDTIYLKETEIPRRESKPGKPLYMALKSNLLYTAALLPNLTLESYLGNQWSLAVEGNWSWWVFRNSVEKEWYHRIQAAGIEIRKWVSSPQPLRGHALGVYFIGGTYDVRLFTEDETTRGWLSDYSWGTGLSYGYSFAMAQRVNLELGIAAGYFGGSYYDYDYCMQHNHWALRSINNRNYWGISRLGVSIVWLFASGKNQRNTP
jgi:hypothetical protein